MAAQYDSTACRAPSSCKNAVDLVGTSLKSLRAISGLLMHLPDDSELVGLFWLLSPIESELTEAYRLLSVEAQA